MSNLTLGAKTRFCPSPTGLMHIGNLRTALFNVLLARHFAQTQPSNFLLRIEDTDKARSQQDYIESLIFDLKWLGLNWQEGPEHEGKHQPYFQSQRTDIYQQYYEQLIKQGKAYYCYCSETELTLTRKSQINAKMAPRYPGTCRHLSDEQIAAKQAKGIQPALRFRVPDNKTIYFDDFIQGSKRFESNDLGDFIIQKADKSASFMFCNAVDDALMQVTHVMRGEDHLTNTPRQILILEALNLNAPQYGHMALITGFDGKPLSKRNGSQSVQSLREQGYFPAAINNYLSRLGHHFESDDLMSVEELGAHFDISRIGRAPARFDLVQLQYWQKEAIMKQDIQSLVSWVQPYVKNWVKEEQIQNFLEVIHQNILLPKDAEYWAQQLLSDDFTLGASAQNQVNETSSDFVVALKAAINLHGTDYQAVVNEIKEKTKLKGKQLFMPIRTWITGACSGPELAKIFALMGKDSLLKRIEQIQSKQG